MRKCSLVLALATGCVVLGPLPSVARADASIGSRAPVPPVRAPGALPSAPTRASTPADASLDRARELLEQADFSGAIEAYDQAAEGDTLGRDELVLLLEGRASAAHAARRSEIVERDLQALLSLEPLHRLDERAPPSLRRTLERLRATIVDRVTITADTTPLPEGIEITPAITNDPASLVRSVRVSVQRDGGWHVETATPVRVTGLATVRYFVEAVGPGGAIVATAGTAERPREASVVLAAEATRIEAPELEPRGDDPWPWVGVGIGVGVAAAIGIVLGIVLTSGQGATRPSAPMEIP